MYGTIESHTENTDIQVDKNDDPTQGKGGWST